MPEHIPDEDLSAYLDDEVGAQLREQIDTHLGSCPTCTQTLTELTLASRALASLPEITVGPDAHRSIRQAVLERSASRPRRWARWALAGSTAALLFGAAGFALLRQASPTVKDSEVATAFASRSFDSDAELREAVSKSPVVKQAVGAYKVADVGASQQDQVAALSGPQVAGGAEPESADDSSTAAATSLAQRSTKAGAPADLASCMRRVISTQPYPIMPIVADPVTFRGESSWLFVFAWTPFNEDERRLDRLQLWVVARSDCRTLNFSQLKP